MDIAPNLDAERYEDLKAVVVDAIKYYPRDQSADAAADEVLHRLREEGLEIPTIPPKNLS